MQVIDLLLSIVAIPVGRLLLMKYLGDPGAFGEALAGIVANKISERAVQKVAERKFDELGELVCTRLVPLFESARERGTLSIEAVAREVGAALDGRVTAEYFVSNDLDPARLGAEIRRGHSLPTGMFSADERAFYERALDEAIRYVVEAASQLPRFDEAAPAESLKRLRRIEDSIERSLDVVQRLEQRITDTEDTESARYEADYRAAVLRDLDHVELFGADIGAETKRQALSVAYVSLRLEEPKDGREEDDAEVPEPKPVELVLGELGTGSSRLLVRGEAGSGKSTLFRWIALQAARGPTGGATIDIERAFDYVERHAKGNLRPTLIYEGLRKWLEYVPFLIRLRDCQSGRLPNAEEFPRLVSKWLGRPPEKWVLSTLKSGKAIIMLDGVDEVPNLHRETVREEVRTLTAAFSKCLFLLSTRPTAVDEGWLRDVGFREATIDEMSMPDIRQFIERWHEAVAGELRTLGRSADGLPQIARELIEKLPEHPALVQLAGNPLICAMICALHRERSQQLPETIGELCDALCQMLLHRREQESRLSLRDFPEEYRRLTYSHKRALVADLAHYMVRNHWSTLANDQADERIASVLRLFDGHTTTNPSVVRRALVERCGMLRESRPGHVDFIHNTLKEYLAADRFVDEGDVGWLARQVLEPAWQPVVLFAAATTAKRTFASALVEAILNEAYRVGGSAPERERALVALRCKSVALQLEPALRERLEVIAKALFPPRTMKDAVALAAIGDAGIPYLHYKLKMRAPQAAACVRTLRTIGTREARRCLEDYLNDDRSTVAAELVHVVDPFKIAAVRSIVRKGWSLPVEIAEHVADISDLSGWTGLSTLDLSFTSITDLSPLSPLKNLVSLTLRSMRRPLNDMAPISALTKLQFLDIVGHVSGDLTTIGSLETLTRLHCSKLPSNIHCLANLHWLTIVNAEDPPDLEDISSLSGLRTLYVLSCGVFDIRPLARLHNLRLLSLVDNPCVDIGPLGELSELDSLSLSATPVQDLSPLRGCRKLTTLNLAYTQVTDLSPLAALPHLSTLVLSGRRRSDLTSIPQRTGLTVTIDE